MAELLLVAITVVNLIVAVLNLLNARGNRRQADENLSMAQENRRNAAAIAAGVNASADAQPKGGA